ncbi:MAG: zinc ABC transporter substrate-binding protein [Desulfurococcaceae archaeon]
MLRYSLIILVFLITGLIITPLTTVASNEKQLNIVVTFNYFKPDVEKLICSGKLYSLIPPGIDPHEYQLKPSDIELLKKSDLIISTGHTSFELKIRDLVNNGEITAKLIDLTEIQGIKYLENPVTGRLNYHMPINDPINYMVFITSLYKTLIEIDSANLKCYTERYLDIINSVAINILQQRDTLTGKTIVDKPHAQYYAEWLGLHVLWIIKPEEEYQVTPGDIAKLRELTRYGDVKVVFVTRPGDSPESKLLLELANENSLPVIWVNNPSNESGVYYSLLDLLNQVNKLLRNNTLTTSEFNLGTCGNNISSYIVFPLMMVSFILGVLSCFIYRRYPRR